MSVTAVNNLVVYLDGVEQPVSPNAARTYTMDSFEVSSFIRTIALKCKGRFNGFSFCLASLDNGMISDASWRCSIGYQEGWYEVNFDDSGWGEAACTGTNVHYGDIQSRHYVDGIVDEALWITGGRSITSYCRKSLREYVCMYVCMYVCISFISRR